MRIALTVILSSLLLFGLSGTSLGRDIGRDSHGLDSQASPRGACKSAKLAEAAAASAPSGAIRVPFRVRIAYFGP